MEFFYRRSGNYLLMVECHLLDKTFRVSFFDFIQRLLSDEKKITDAVRDSIHNFLLGHLDDLLSIDDKKGTRFFPLQYIYAYPLS